MDSYLPVIFSLICCFNNATALLSKSSGTKPPPMDALSALPHVHHLDKQGLLQIEPLEKIRKHTNVNASDAKKPGGSLLRGNAADDPIQTLRVLFIGNSFTYVNDLPEQFAHVAASLGDHATVSKSAIGGCTLYAQESSRDETTKKLLEESWDYIVLQDYSALPIVKAARERYMSPAIRNFVGSKKEAKIVMYLTWAYHDGDGSCPNSDKLSCFPSGTLLDLTKPSCKSSTDYQTKAGNFPCMGYAIARGYLDTYKDGADLVAPCGLAWQIVRSVQNIPVECKASIDSEYDAPLDLSLPLEVEGGALPDLMLYRLLATSIDKHPNVAGQYLNALTFYATLFGKSPIGAAPPLNTGDASYGDRTLTASELRALQTAAQGAVLKCGKACNLPGLLLTEDRFT